MAKRFPVPEVHCGRVTLSEADSHHARAVMRLGVGDSLEVFDAAGHSADAVIVFAGTVMEVEVASVRQPAGQRLRLSVASAVPKGQRADWLVEKLAEIGVDEFIPLQTSRSVVHPEGASKNQRWERLAAEAAKQSRREGAMQVAPLTPVVKLIQGSVVPTWHLSTGAGARPLAQAISDLREGSLRVLVGPEGGWTDEEESLFLGRGSIAVSLTRSVLRIETAGLVAAGTILSYWRD